MADNHESCFLCKRSNPDRHVYYKDYEELEGQHIKTQHFNTEYTKFSPVYLHYTQQLLSVTCTKYCLVIVAEHFRHEHYLCEDSICKQEHFQVWATEAELQQHRVRVHGDNMSRHEKRQAMRIPLDINVSSNTLEQHV